MTSSWALTQRKKMGKTWDIANFSNPGNSLGGWEDHYIINGACRECHPDFEAIPMGNPYGFMICKRRTYPDGVPLDVVNDPIDPSQWNGYNKYMADLYRPWRKTQIQTADPYNYYDRTVPNEQMLHRYDYLAREIAYDGTGIKPIHTPGPRKYYEYGFSFSPNPPYKYDVNQLNQKYSIWKDTQKYHGMPQEKLDEIDQKYHDSVPAGTW